MNAAAMADGSFRRSQPLAEPMRTPTPNGPTTFQLSLIVSGAVGGLVLGGLVLASGRSDIARWIWAAALAPALIYLCAEIVAKLRRGNPGLDIVAAFAMIFALALGETLAGAVVALMYSGGQMLENFAHRRAHREMTVLLSRVPKTAARHAGPSIERIPTDAIAVGDRLLIESGEAVPADGTVAEGVAVLDQSMLTGEALPVHRRNGEPVSSGSINIGSPFDLTVTRPASESAYAAIVRLVEAAQDIKSPMVRLADRYGLWFLAATAIIVAVTWLVSNEPTRALAVLVVATPCPLILAVPVAIMSGMSHCAKHGVLVKEGGALETLARVNVVVIDKTGTLTQGRARLVKVEAFGGFSDGDVLRLAATLDLASHHVVAAALVSAATERGLALGRPIDVAEAPGVGIEGLVEGRRVAVGGAGYVRKRLTDAVGAIAEQTESATQFSVMVAVDGELAGRLVLADKIRDDTAESIKRFRTAGVKRIVLASGDRSDVTHAIGAQVDIDEIHGSLTPQDKVALVVRERNNGCVMMAGDGVNDAPALAAADLGVALGVRGAAASSEAADVVLLVDRIGALADAIEIARRARRVALQSANAGIGLSLIAMSIAAFGYLPPVEGALIQEGIDVAVVLNALRALGGGPKHVADTSASG
jgi:heavy metal translocating P-type ATPase